MCDGAGVKPQLIFGKYKALPVKFVNKTIFGTNYKLTSSPCLQQEDLS